MLIMPASKTINKIARNNSQSGFDVYQMNILNARQIFNLKLILDRLASLVHLKPVGILKGNAAYQKKIILWMKTIHYPNTIGYHLVTIVPMAPFTPKSTSKLRSALHFRYSKVIPRFISRPNTAQT